MLDQNFNDQNVSVVSSQDMPEAEAKQFITELYDLMLTMVPDDEIDSLEELIKYDQESRDPENKNKINFFGAYNGPELVGFGSRSALENGGGFAVYLGVKPEHRSTREQQTPFASELVGAMDNWGAEVQGQGKNIEFIELEPPDNETAISRLRSFERLGYAKINIPVYAG